MNFDALFVNPNGRTPRGQFIPAMIIVIAVMVFFTWLVTGRTAQFCVLVLMYPAFVLLSRRLQDMGLPAMLVLVPLALMLCSQLIQLGAFSLGSSINTALYWGAPAITAAFILWGCSGTSRSA